MVTDEEIEKILNEWTGKGHEFESFQFITSVSSKRPAMAFVFFTKKESPQAPVSPSGEVFAKPCINRSRPSAAA